MVDIRVVQPGGGQPETFLTRGYYGKKKRKHGKKEKEDEECPCKKITETGFGKLYDEIEDRKEKRKFIGIEKLIK